MPSNSAKGSVSCRCRAKTPSLLSSQLCAPRTCSGLTGGFPFADCVASRCPTIRTMLRNDADSWGALAKLFHWVMAALILAQIALGVMAASWRVSPTKVELFFWHKSTGMLILALVALRLLWRLANPAPELPSGIAAWERAAARLSHLLLYVLMIALPVTGWIVNSASNVPFRIFWLIPLPAIVAPDEPTADLAALVHGALRHHFVKRDAVLERMLPGIRRAP
ncbi:MAG: cytochrome b [Betaproteobacteria bacterium]|nr:MAG: cytochrome b [Betaproteobacteria bacterium]